MTAQYLQLHLRVRRQGKQKPLHQRRHRLVAVAPGKGVTGEAVKELPGAQSVEPAVKGCQQTLRIPMIALQFAPVFGKIQHLEKIFQVGGQVAGLVQEKASLIPVVAGHGCQPLLEDIEGLHGIEVESLAGSAEEPGHGGTGAEGDAAGGARRGTDDGAVERRRSVGKLENLAAVLREQPMRGCLGIGHTQRVLPVEGNSQSVPRAFNGELLDTVVYVDLVVGDEVATNYRVFDRFRELRLQPATVQVAREGATLTLTSDAPAFGVFVETEHDVDLSANCLNLEPGRPVTVVCSADPGAVEVVHLVDLVARI